MKNNKTASTMLKQSAMILAAITFVLGFFTGAGFTVYKTDSISGAAASKSQDNAHADRVRKLNAELKSNPDNKEILIQLGHEYFDTDQYEKAIIAYEKALEIDPKNADVLTDLGVMYRRSGQPRQAVEKFELASKIDPRHEHALLNKGIVLMHDLNNTDGAIKAWEKLLKINPLAMAGKDQSVDQLLKHYKEDHDNNISK